MKISIITVCRNAAVNLEKTIRSIISQDFDNIEFIIIDGASTDSTNEIVKQYRDFISVSVSEPDKGIYDAMNKGTRLATGEWVIFMNAGDCFADGHVATRLAEEAEHSDSGVIYGDVIKDSLNTEYVKKAEEAHNSHRMFFCHQSSMVRRELLLKYPFDLSYPFSADFKFFKTLFKAGIGFKNLGFPVARFDTGGISNRKRSSGLADNMKVIRDVDGFFKGIPFIIHIIPTWAICRIKGR